MSDNNEAKEDKEDVDPSTSVKAFRAYMLNVMTTNELD